MSNLMKLATILVTILAFQSCGAKGGASASAATLAPIGSVNHHYEVFFTNGATAHNADCSIWKDYSLGVYQEVGFPSSPIPTNATTKMADFTSFNLVLVCQNLTNNAGTSPIIQVYEDGVAWARSDVLNFNLNVILRDETICDPNGTPQGSCTHYTDGN